MNRLRNRLILLFLAATLVPLAATLWLSTSLLERSLGYASTQELDKISRLLEQTGREFYQRSREALKAEALAGRLADQHYDQRQIGQWPEAVREFWDSAQP